MKTSINLSNIGVIHGYDYSNGVQVDPDTIQKWIEECTEHTIQESKTNSKRVGYAHILFDNSVVIVTVQNFKDFNIFVSNSGYKRYEKDLINH